MLFPTTAFFALSFLATTALSIPLTRSAIHTPPPALNLPALASARLASAAFPSNPLAPLSPSANPYGASPSSSRKLAKRSKKSSASSTPRAYHASVLALAQRLTENATAQPLHRRPLAAAKKVARHAARAGRAFLTPLSLANQSITHQQRGIRRRRAEFAPSVRQRAEVVIDDHMSF